MLVVAAKSVSVIFTNTYNVSKRGTIQTKLMYGMVQVRDQMRFACARAELCFFIGVGDTFCKSWMGLRPRRDVMTVARLSFVFLCKERLRFVVAPVSFCVRENSAPNKLWTHQTRFSVVARSIYKHATPNFKTYLKASPAIATNLCKRQGARLSLEQEGARGIKVCKWFNIEIND